MSSGSESGTKSHTYMYNGRYNTGTIVHCRKRRPPLNRFCKMATSGAPSSDAPSVRTERLREVATRALDESLGGCSPDDFCAGFVGIDPKHHELLRHVYEQAQGCLRENTLVSGGAVARTLASVVDAGTGSPLPHPSFSARPPGPPARPHSVPYVVRPVVHRRSLT